MGFLNFLFQKIFFIRKYLGGLLYFFLENHKIKSREKMNGKTKVMERLESSLRPAKMKRFVKKDDDQGDGGDHSEGFEHCNVNWALPFQAPYVDSDMNHTPKYSLSKSNCNR